MKLRKVISGGQTGADRTALEEAKRLGFEVGGYCPRGYRTERGDDLSLAQFNLIQTAANDYTTRTRLNVVNSHATVWFGTLTSPGYKLTKKYADEYERPFFMNPTETDMKFISENYEVVNFAGNRWSKNPHVVNLVRAAFKGLEP